MDTADILALAGFGVVGYLVVKKLSAAPDSAVSAPSGPAQPDSFKVASNPFAAVAQGINYLNSQVTSGCSTGHMLDGVCVTRTQLNDYTTTKGKATGCLPANYVAGTDGFLDIQISNCIKARGG